MEIICAQCRKPFVKASRRDGILDRLLSLAYAYPFRCQICRHRFHLWQWNLRYIERDVDRRQYDRRPVSIHARITSEQHDYEGTVKDLALGGCAIETQAPLHEGAVLSLQLDAFDNEPRITVETAVVRSVKGTRVGVEFLRLTPQKEEERLRQYILDLWVVGTQEARKGAGAAA
jgi:c-di-GMP-binding flagellar brake protein YcgR